MATETLLVGDSVSRMQVTVREGFVTLPLRCAQCQKSNDSKSSYVLCGVVHRFFHSLRGKMFRTSFKFQVSSFKFLDLKSCLADSQHRCGLETWNLKLETNLRFRPTEQSSRRHGRVLDAGVIHQPARSVLRVP